MECAKGVTLNGNTLVEHPTRVGAAHTVLHII